MKLAKRIALGAVAVLVVALIAFAIYVGSRQNLKFDHAVPAIRASQDAAVVARGEYLVRRMANCAYCHGDPNRLKDAFLGKEDIALSGGRTWDIPPGSFRAYNITPDRETGIGAASDAELVRALRFGIGRDGRALLPFMEMQGLADDDLGAVISYLRVQTPVRHAVPPHDIGLLGKIVKATLLAEPVGPKAQPPKLAPRGATVENGRYLVESVANCWACHTERSEKTGELVGPRFGGARLADELEPKKRAWNAPNLTSHSSGRVGQMGEEAFVARMKGGRVYEFSPMPWNSFARLDEDDLRAIYRYLRTVPKVDREMGQALVEL
ncbi:MAG TPA: c-type cytochrome [Polyangiaceae bacterium]